MMNKRVHTRSLGLLLVVCAAMLLTACRSERMPGLEFMPGMMDQEALKAYEAGTLPGQQRASRTPVPGTIARNQAPITANLSAADAEKLANPLPMDRPTLERGQEYYDIYCLVCHGKTGEGDGTIVPHFPRPPSILSDKASGFSDGRLFQIISAGQNLMPSYAAQISIEDRWAIVHYLRVLQRAGNPTSEDIEAVRKALQN